MSRIPVAFGSLLLAQTAHSIEEYLGRLWESFPPARWLSGMLSSDLERGFVTINLALIAFGLWTLLWPVRGRWPSARALLWLWVVSETINGIGHPAWSLLQGGYTPGVLTAPILLFLALYLSVELRRHATQCAAVT